MGARPALSARNFLDECADYALCKHESRWREEQLRLKHDYRPDCEQTRRDQQVALIDMEGPALAVIAIARPKSSAAFA
jgi:hypothetical protein